MTVAMPVLLFDVHPSRSHEVEMVPGARHRDVEQAPLLLELIGGSDAEV